MVKKTATLDGYGSHCKECHRLRGKSKKSMIYKMHQNQEVRSRKRGHALPAYTRVELYMWFLKQENSDRLYQAWVKSGFLRSKAPSVDRLDDAKGYSFDNIQLITTEQNNKSANKDRRKGMDATSINVILKRFGKELGIYPSITIAASSINYTKSTLSKWLAFGPSYRSPSGYSLELSNLQFDLTQNN